MYIIIMNSIIYFIKKFKIIKIIYIFHIFHIINKKIY